MNKDAAKKAAEKSSLHRKAMAAAMRVYILETGSEANQFGLNRAIHAYEAAMDAAGTRRVPVKPSPGLLVSMACCLDHGFGAPPMGEFDYRKPTLREYQQRMLSDMRKLHAEIVGKGFHSAKREAEYVSWLAAATATAP